MFVIIEEHYNEITPKNNTGQISSIKTDALMNLVPNTFHYADMRGNRKFLSSEILSYSLCTTAERVPNTLLFK
jgi:hypothetical protein